MAETEWTRRAHLFVRASIAAIARDKAEQIMPDTNERRMFDIGRYSITGEDPVQVFGCNTALKPAFVQRWKDEFIDLNPDNVRWYLLNAGDNSLIATNSETVTPTGQIWSFDDSLNDMGIQLIQVTYEPEAFAMTNPVPNVTILGRDVPLSSQWTWDKIIYPIIRKVRRYDT